MRLNKYIAQSGLCSRRKADELIKNGNVKINGISLKEMGYDVLPDDRVEVNGKEISHTPPKKVYVMLNKPLGYITSSKDEFERLTVLSLVKDVDAKLFPVGRLDYNTSGLLIMTNDGDFAYRLTHPKHHIHKTYLARVKGKLSKEKLAKLRNGIDIGGFITSRANVKIVKDAERSTIVEIQIYEGKNRQVRKMFAAVGNPVQELKRISIGDVRLGRLKEGHYRKLSPTEISYLKGE